jgi:hypothetical protein
LATLWAILFQIHLVTLPATGACSPIGMKQVTFYDNANLAFFPLDSPAQK